MNTTTYPTTDQQADLDRLAASMTKMASTADDHTVVALMWTNVKRGQQANRKGDVHGEARHEVAYNILRAEAVKRNLVER